MLTYLEMTELLDKFGLSAEGKAFVLGVRDTAPARQVQSTGNNFVTHYQSRKMARVLDFESHTVEYRAGLLSEYDPAVLEYYAQPKKVAFHLKGPITGKDYRVEHTPDFLVISDHAIYVDEWKPEERLTKLSKRQPDRFIKEQGAWRSPLLEGYFRPMGLNYRLRSSRDIPQLRIANLEFLSSYLDKDCPKVPKAVWDRVKSLFQGRPDIELAELLADPDEGGNGYIADDIYKMIADGDLMIDFDNDEVHETDRLRVYRDAASLYLGKIKEASARDPIRESLAASLVAGARVGFDDRVLEVISAGNKQVLLKGGERVVEVTIDDLERLFQEGKITISGGPGHAEEEGASSHSLASLTPEEMAVICKRIKLIEQAASAPALAAKCRRTIQRYKKAMREGGESLIQQHLSLVPKHASRGNRTRRLQQDVLDLIQEVARLYYNTPNCPTKEAAYRVYKRLSIERKQDPCSIKSFSRELQPKVVKREGRKRAYQEGSIIWYLDATVPIHGVRPFQFVHIDCTPLEIVVLDPKTGEILGTVWLCLAVDAESRRVLGFYLSFERPGARTTLMVIRDIVRRHGRMPESIIVDWGPENVNAQLQRVCMIFGTHIRQRPKGQPRAGSILERLFGTTHTQLIHLLEGNTKIKKHYRQVTKAVRPENFAAWTFVALHGALDEYFEELYGKNPHPAHGSAPVEYFKKRLVETGERRHRLVRYDRLFKIETCPEPLDGPTRKVDRHRGIKVNYIWYWSEAFRNPSIDGMEVQVRFDPWDPGAVFALVGKNWEDCTSKYRSLLSRLTWVELRYALDEIKNRLGSRKLPLTPERVEEWMRALDPKNFDGRLAAEQSEMRLVYEGLGMAGVLPKPETVMVGPGSEKAGESADGQNSPTMEGDGEGRPEKESVTTEAHQKRSAKAKRYDDDYPLL